MKCPKCGSTNLVKHGLQWRLTLTGGHKVQRYRCNTCGRFTVHPKTDDSK